jgi:broad specificity phosphatase PhoE
LRILWARHGQNVANLTRTLSHRVFDGDLTDLGRQQAELLADQLASGRGDRVGQILCSPLRRARQTARIINDRLGLPVACELDDLRELNVGSLDGRSDDDAWVAYNAVLAAWSAGQVTARFPGGEDYGELCTRLRRALVTAARAPVGSTTLIAAHGASLRAAIPGLTGEPAPAVDLATGATATLHVDVDVGAQAPVVRLVNWPEAGPAG